MVSENASSKQSLITEIMQKVESTIGNLHEASDLLVKRLEPVMLVSSPVPADCETKEARQSSQLVGFLQHMNEEIQKVVYRLDKARKDLEL